MARGNFPWRMKVVADRPMRNAVIAVVVVIAVFLVGYWLGRQHSPSLASDQPRVRTDGA